MLALTDSRKAVRARSTAQTASAHVAHTTAQPLSGAVAQRARYTEVLDKDLSQADVCAGFQLVDSAGEFVAWSACIVAACERMRDDDMRHVTRIERCSDGTVMMFRRAKKKTPAERWDQAVPL